MSSGGSNPCCCWNLKDGCITIGVWSLIYSIIQMGIFSWQVAVIKWIRDRMENRKVPGYQSYGLYENRLGGGDWADFYITPEEKIYLALFVVQIVNLIVAFFLLFASVALIYGIHTSSKFLVWPWFPCIIASIICAITYCVLWWIGNVVSYWVALTVIEFIAVVINVYCLLCIFMQYRRILKGYVQYEQDEDFKPKQVVYEYRTTDGERQEEISTYRKEDNYYSHKQGVDGYLNATYEHEPPPATKVTIYSNGDGCDDKEIPKQELTTTQVERQEIDIIEGRTQRPEQQDKTVATVNDRLEPTEYKDIFTEEWLRNVMTRETSGQQNKEGRNDELFDDSRRKAHRERANSKRCKSMNAVEEKSTKDKHKSKSKESVTSKRSHRSRKSHGRDSSSSCEEEEKSKGDSKSRRSRSESGRRHMHRHHHHRRHDKDSDVKTCRSDEESEKPRDKHSSKKDKDSKRKRPRDVKREDKERLAGKSSDVAGQRPDSTSTDRTTTTQTGGLQSRAASGGIPHYPMTAAGGISIPQHVVIPPQAGRSASHPQKYQINSEIVISYSNKSAASSDAENRRSRLSRVVPTVTAPSPQSSSVISTAAVATQTAAGVRTGDSSGGDSKSRGSTAV